MSKPLVGLIMGSQSDWPTLKIAAEVLAQLDVPFESKIVSAHRTPDRMATYAKDAVGRGLKVIIAAAGGAAHLPADEPHSPAFQVSALTTHAPYQDEGALRKFARTCHAITFEFENVPAASLELVSCLAPANPCVRSLTITQDRLLEKNLVKA